MLVRIQNGPHYPHARLRTWPLAKATQEGLYFTQLLNEMDISAEYVLVKIIGDNQSVIALSEDSVHRQSCKHVDIKCHFFRDPLHTGSVNIIHCPITDWFTDIMTKPPTRAKLKKKKKNSKVFGLVSLFNGILTFVGYLMPNLFP